MTKKRQEETRPKHRPYKVDNLKDAETGGRKTISQEGQKMCPCTLTQLSIGIGKPLYSNLISSPERGKYGNGENQNYEETLSEMNCHKFHRSLVLNGSLKGECRGRIFKPNAQG